jgi:electron transfer flavoprotein alpha subunit
VTAPQGILCYSEEVDRARELLRYCRARDLAAGGPVAAAILGETSPDTPAHLAEAGAQTVYRMSASPPPLPDPHVLAPALASIIREVQPELVLVSSTKRGRELAGRVAGLLDLVAETGVTDLRREGDRWVLEREALSGNAIAQESLSAPVAVIAMTPGLEAPAVPPAPLAVRDVAGSFPPPLTELRERRKKSGGGVRLEDAERIVTVGRGLRQREDIPLVESLARALGAAVGCTRPLAAEAGWFSDDHWIGLTGHRVKPKLYVAVGVSGAVQHLVGMRGSRLVVAINKDPNAPIFQQADYGVPGDLYQLIPALLKVLGASVGTPS